MKKLPFILLICALMLVCCGKKGEETTQSEEESGAITIPGERSGSASDWKITKLRVPSPSELDRTPVLVELFNDSNYVQYEFAERLGIEPITSLAEAYNTRRPLVKVESSSDITVDKLTHSMPYLVPEAATLLKDIGAAFADSLEKRTGRKGYRPIVTSMLRSKYSVKRLRRVNRNAVDSSTHMFATTFDIAWNNFNCVDSTVPQTNAQLKRILAQVLLQKRNEGRCLVKYERKTPCFHITVTR